MKLAHQPPKLLMLLLIGSEAFFFGSLIMGYLYLAFVNPHWQRDSQYLDVFKTGIFTFFLIGSSGTLILSEHFGHKGNMLWEILFLVATIISGAIFLVGQGIEYTALFRLDIDPSNTIFTSAFFTITGFHAFHVIVGLFSLSVVLILFLKRANREKLGGSIRYVGLYWHFVDIVWVGVFSVIYILPRII